MGQAPLEPYLWRMNVHEHQLFARVFFQCELHATWHIISSIFINILDPPDITRCDQLHIIHLCKDAVHKVFCQSLYRFTRYHHDDDEDIIIKNTTIHLLWRLSLLLRLIPSVSFNHNFHSFVMATNTSLSDVPLVFSGSACKRPGVYALFSSLFFLPALPCLLLSILGWGGLGGGLRR